MAPARRALLVGVSYSQWFDENPDRCPGYQTLQSTATGIELMREMLVESFSFDDVEILRDHKATQKAILEEMDRLAEQTGDGDIVFFYYAGHGSTMSDPRDPTRELATLAPFDTGREPAPNYDIPNVVFDRWVRRLNDKTANVTLIFDCCHSGTLGRDPFSLPISEVEADLRPVSEMFEDGRVPDFFPASPDRERRMMRSGWLPRDCGAVVIGACRSTETTLEIWRRDGLDSFYYGALTYHLTQAITALSPGATWRDVLEKVTPAVLREVDGQHPQIEGDIDRVVAGLGHARPAAYLSVVSVDGDAVELWGGILHGVTPESLWMIAPHGTRSRSAGTEVGRVRVKRLRAATARSLVEGKAPGRIEAGQRAFLLQRNLRAPGLPVVIAAPEDRRRQLAAEIGEWDVLRVVEAAGGTGADDVIVRCLEPRADAGPGDPYPLLGPLTERTWAAVGRSGRLQTRPRPDDPRGLEDLVTDLTRLARYRGFRDLKNPDPESPLRGKVELRIVEPRGEQVKPKGRGVVVVEEGTMVDFEIENRHHSEVWISFLELAGDYSIAFMMPRKKHHTWRRGGYRLEPGKRLRVGRDYYGAEDGFEQLLPDGFPWAADSAEEMSVAYLTLLVTSVRADFEFLKQKKARFTATHPLRKLALLYHSNVGSRQVILAADEVADDKDWTVVTREIGIRRSRAGDTSAKPR